jgi:mevalonate pyrophosphate decarboxylase
MIDYSDTGFYLESLIERSQKDMYSMHSLLMYSGNMVLSSGSISLIEKLKKFRLKNEGNIFYTADTGPSISVISDDEKLLSEFMDQNPGSIRGSIPDQSAVQVPLWFTKEAEEYFGMLRS